MDFYLVRVWHWDPEICIFTIVSSDFISLMPRFWERTSGHSGKGWQTFPVQCQVVNNLGSSNHCKHSSALLSQHESSHRQYVNEGMWLCAKKNVVVNTEIWTLYNFDMLLNIILLLVFSQPFKMEQPLLIPGLTKTSGRPDSALEQGLADLRCRVPHNHWMSSNPERSAWGEGSSRTQSQKSSVIWHKSTIKALLQTRQTEQNWCFLPSTGILLERMIYDFLQFPKVLPHFSELALMIIRIWFHANKNRRGEKWSTQSDFLKVVFPFPMRTPFQKIRLP